ncbi:VOC family protein [Diaphorobacter limosus]|jgi:catechol 2,3-dioxygenase-like lactoylglutathione lyase family enzyme|uniref:VOC family protein n=1 Tax=Diaphorobacter limosus TaxID=3036128 RepID=A0ABZ0J0J0_9BURK|nr:VOC family protein [Diaphorobacter sp. Y-1]MBP8137969.1 VOC family protein [Alicycliphilus sp.]MCA0441614.1 VOC family protein [Pseudomonadota bacterium]WOO31543.1 VOC family protein [Diaphorobacter sp. Y-1]
MFSHVMLGASDLDQSKQFYDAVLGALGAGPGFTDKKNRTFWRHAGNTFAITAPINGEPACHGNGSTIGFAAQSPEQAAAAHAAGVAAGGTTCEDPPGWRGDHGAGGIYLAYLRDPDGNKLCVLHRPPKAA